MINTDAAYKRAAARLLSLQKNDGAWIGEVELNPGPTAQVIMLYAALQMPFPKKLSSKTLNYITRTQNKDGGWSPHFGVGSEVSLTVECYIGLRLLGLPISDARLLKAHACIMALGGVPKANPWTQLYCAVLGLLPWGSILKTPVEIMLLPKFWPMQVKDLSYWVRVITVPMALLGAVGPGEPIALAKDLRRELGVEGHAGPIASYEGFAKLIMPLVSGVTVAMKFRRGEALRRAWKMIDGFTEASGDFGGNTCTAINVLLALHRTGQTGDGRFERGLEALMTYGVETADEWHVQTCQSHIWDTGFALTALKPDYSDETTHAARKAVSDLQSRQILDVRGDWSANVSAEPGGWCFGNHHDHYPVTDCTALALLGISTHAPDVVKSPEFMRGIDWLCAMQTASGGWSAYQRYERGEWLNYVFKFKDIDNALVDVPKVDVSAKVLEALAQSDQANAKDSCAKGRKFLLSQRNEQGIWSGNYGINFIYGSAFACKALRAIDGRASSEWAAAPRSFFSSIQNQDGGWGENDHVGNEYVKESVPSGAVQTAWALMGLKACDDGSASVAAAIERGTNYLLSTQKENGGWDDPHFLGTVFKGMVYFRYELYEIYFPMMAIKP